MQNERKPLKSSLLHSALIMCLFLIFLNIQNDLRMYNVVLIPNFYSQNINKHDLYVSTIHYPDTAVFEVD